MLVQIFIAIYFSFMKFREWWTNEENKFTDKGRAMC